MTALTDVRRLGRLVECLHAPVYFAPEPQEAYHELGLRGFWRGYFAGRAAALGPANADEVARLFGGFAPRMVARAIPEVWTMTTPAAVLAARQAAATAALTRLLASTLPRDSPSGEPQTGNSRGNRATLPRDSPSGGPQTGNSRGNERVADGALGAVRAAAERLEAIVDGADVTGRPLAAAHRLAPRPEDPVGRLWHAATVLRELRGDAHLEALGEQDLPWPQPHILVVAAGRADAAQRDYRGWSEDEWAAATAALTSRGLLGTAAGAALLERVEARTDELAAPAFAAADGPELIEALQPLAVAAAAELPFPNAMALPRPL